MLGRGAQLSKFLMFQDVEGGGYVSLGMSLPSDELLLKDEAVSKKHLTRNFDVARFCCQK